MATHKLPGRRVLETLGVIALRHGHLDNALKMLIMDLASVTKEVALSATAMQSSHELRERVRKLAKQRIGEGPALVKLDALLRRAQLATERRNELLHSTWGAEKTTAVMRDNHHVFRKVRTRAQLDDTVAELEKVLEDAILARGARGFFFEALHARSKSK